VVLGLELSVGRAVALGRAPSVGVASPGRVLGRASPAEGASPGLEDGRAVPVVTWPSLAGGVRWTAGVAAGAELPAGRRTAVRTVEPPAFSL
jgi:hypothetical protein